MVRVIANENSGALKHGKIHCVPLQHLSNDHSDYGCMAAVFLQHEILCELSCAIEIYYKKRQKPEQKQLNSETPLDLKTPCTLEPILPAVCEKNCFPISLLSQRKTTLVNNKN